MWNKKPAIVISFTFSWLGAAYCLLHQDGVTVFKQEILAMFTRTSIALAVLVAISSGALAASKRHDATANAYGRSIDDLCRQTGPITLPATHPICNTKDFMGW